MYLVNYIVKKYNVLCILCFFHLTYCTFRFFSLKIKVLTNFKYKINETEYNNLEIINCQREISL